MTVPTMKTWTFTDKPHDGNPWNAEPDKAQWIDEATGLDCLIVRGPLGALCGYVGLPPNHPWHGTDADHVDAAVHGGLNYAAPCQEHAGERAICHVPEPGRPADVWWLGFDCAHAGDLNPITGPITGDEVYRDFAYVQAEVARLAAQLAHVAP